MKKLIAAAALLALALATSGQAKAAEYDGDSLYSDCTSSDSSDRIFCFGYMIGAMQTMDIKNSCIPSTLKPIQVSQIFTEWVRANPGMLDIISGGMAVQVAMTAAYPCKPGERRRYPQPAVAPIPPGPYRGVDQLLPSK